MSRDSWTWVTSPQIIFILHKLEGFVLFVWGFVWRQVLAMKPGPLTHETPVPATQELGWQGNATRLN